MPAAPQNPRTVSTARDVTRFVARLGAEGGVAPTKANEDPTFQPLVVSRSAGGRTVDYCTFSVDLGKKEQHLIDMETPTAWNRQIEVRIPPVEPPTDEEVSAGTDRDDPVFWGMLASQTLSLTAPNTESASVVARVDRHLYGGPLTGMRVRDPRTATMVLVEMDPVFNPLVDGQIWANRSAHKDPNTEVGMYVWVHPESIKTEPALTYQGETSRAAWTLAGMVYTLCRFLNSAETYIKNPTREELQASIVDQSPPEIENFWIPRGQYLPQYLDSILTPHGFGWFLKVGTDSSGASIRKITVFKRGAGEEKEVFLQRQGVDAPVDLDPAKTNLKDLTHELSVADLANKVYGYGNYQEREITLELYRGWLEADDALTAEALDKTETAANGSVYLAHPDAWRLWVANEAGDWKDYRTVAPNAIPAPRDLSAVFEKFTPRRRRIEDCLQTDVNGRRIPPVVHFYNPTPPDGGAAKWVQLPPGSYSVLTDQIGIRFNGSKPPDEIVLAGAAAKIRITGTVAGDARLYRGADRRPESPNGLDVILFLDLANRFFDRSVQTTGTYLSVIAEDAIYQPEDLNDGDDLQAYVNAVRNTEDAANIRAGITLSGIKREYEIGNLITKVDGRNISFNRLAKNASEKRYLQIVGIDLNQPSQETILRVEMNADEGYERDGSFGGPIGKKLRITS